MDSEILGIYHDEVTDLSSIGSFLKNIPSISLFYLPFLFWLSHLVDVYSLSFCLSVSILSSVLPNFLDLQQKNISILELCLRSLSPKLFFPIQISAKYCPY